MLQTADNVAIRRSVLAVAGAHARMPGFDRARALELAHRIEALAADEQGMHVMVALAVLLLKGMGVLDASDSSRLSRG